MNGQRYKEDVGIDDDEMVHIYTCYSSLQTVGYCCSPVSEMQNRAKELDHYH